MLDCVAVAAAGDGALRRALEDTGRAGNLAAADAAAAACVVEVRSAPRFAEDVQRASGGKLTDEQLACAAREYGRLTPEQVEAVAGAVLNPEQASKGATDPVGRIYEKCGIEREAE